MTPGDTAHSAVLNSTLKNSLRLTIQDSERLHEKLEVRTPVMTLSVGETDLFETCILEFVQWCR